MLLDYFDFKKIGFVFILFFLLFLNSCYKVSADSEVLYGFDRLSFEDLTPRYLNGVDDSDGVEYYYEERSPSYFNFSAPSPRRDIPEQEPFESYPYWVFFNNKVYASEHPFEFLDGSIVTPIEEYGINFEFYSYTFGMFKTGSVYSFNISGDFERVYSNYEIKKHKKDSGKEDHRFNYDLFSESYTVVSDNHEYDLSGHYRYLRLNYYVFRTNVNEDFGFFRTDDGSYRLGFYDGDEFGKKSSTCRYSYFGSEYFTCFFYSTIKNVPIGYIDDETILRHYVLSNYNVRYPGGFLSVTSPNLMPPGWKPTYGDNKIPKPGGDGGNGGDGGDGGNGEDGGWMDILNFINPFSDKFFLKIAFVPSDDYFINKFDRLVSSGEKLTDSYSSIRESLEVLFAGNHELESRFSWEGIEYGDGIGFGGPVYRTFPEGAHSGYAKCFRDPPGGAVSTCYKFYFDLSDFKLLDAKYIKDYIFLFRKWISSIIWFFFMIWIVKWLLSFFGYHMPSGGYTLGSKEKD